MSTLITTTAQIGTIKDAGGTSAMTIDSSGRVFRSVIPHIFAVRRDASGGGYVTVGNGAKYEFNTMIESGGGFALSSGMVQIPVTGLYQFTATCLNNNVENNELSLFVTGATTYFLRQFVSSQRGMSLSFTKRFNANDTIEMRNTAGGNRGWHYTGPDGDGDIYTHMSGHLIG